MVQVVNVISLAEQRVQSQWLTSNFLCYILSYTGHRRTPPVSTPRSSRENWSRNGAKFPIVYTSINNRLGKYKITVNILYAFQTLSFKSPNEIYWRWCLSAPPYLFPVYRKYFIWVHKKNLTEKKKHIMDCSLLAYYTWRKRELYIL